MLAYLNVKHDGKWVIFGEIHIENGARSRVIVIGFVEIIAGLLEDVQYKNRGVVNVENFNTNWLGL